MAWKTIVEANSLDEFKEASGLTIRDLPAGTPVRLTFELPVWMPVAHFADIAGGEWVAQRFYNEARIQIDDVYGEGWRTVVFEGTVVGTPVLAIIIAVGAILVSIGILWVTRAKFEADIAETQRKAEEARIAFIEKYEPIYGDVVLDWLNGITKPPPEVTDPSLLGDLKKALPGIGIGAGTIIVIGLVLFLLMGRRK